ncbi:hypothetical protein K3217_12805 [bacterium BD-1]|nr:hypothetical protein [Ottowia caeni]
MAEAGSLGWRGAGSSLSRRAGAVDFRVLCGSIAMPCEGGGTSVLLYSSAKAPRYISMQVGYLDAGDMLRLASPQGMKISLFGKTGVAPDLGVYVRVGTFFGRSVSSLTPSSYGKGSEVSYGMGVSFKLSRKASGGPEVDSYDFRTSTGNAQVWAASLRLQWRY